MTCKISFSTINLNYKATQMVLLSSTITQAQTKWDWFLKCTKFIERQCSIFGNSSPLHSVSEHFAEHSAWTHTESQHCTPSVEKCSVTLWDEWRAPYNSPVSMIRRLDPTTWQESACVHSLRRHQWECLWQRPSLTSRSRRRGTYTGLYSLLWDVTNCF